MWILMLNDMRASRVEITTEVCRASSKRELEEFYYGEMVKAYQDGQWTKEFKKGGPLEWYNPSVWRNPFVEVGSRESVVNHAIQSANDHYTKLEQTIPTLEALRGTARV